MAMTETLVAALRESGQDWEWYPTTRRMVEAILSDLRGDGDFGVHCGSVLDVGAGDGRVLMMFAEAFAGAKLYAIEKSTILQQQQPDVIIPAGAEFIEQDLMALPVDVVFCNPPYSEYQEWAERIISTAHADRLYLVLPHRWEASEAIAGALKRRDAKAAVIHRDHFLEADRPMRPSGWDWEKALPSVVHVIRVTFKGYERSWSTQKQDPFDLYFDENFHTFDQEPEIGSYEQEERALARIYSLDNIPAMVAAYNQEYARMEGNYRAIFRLDGALLKELGVDKNAVREGLKARIKGLKNIYWRGLFQRLDVITCRLTTKTKKGFLERLTGQTGIAFTESNAYAVVIWSIKAANKYFDAQVIDVYRELSTHDGVTNYASNQRTWVKDGWRYNSDEPPNTHYKLDYRVVLHHYSAIFKGGFGSYDYPGNLHTSCHETVDDLIAVFANLGFRVQGAPPRARVWHANQWQDFCAADGRVIFQMKAYGNGNMHFRFDQKAIMALNVEAGRLLGWLRSPADVVKELGYTPEDAAQFFGANRLLGAASVRLLTAAA